MRADPYLAAADHLPAILEPDGLIGTTDPLPVRHMFALIADRRWRIRLHAFDYPRCAPGSSERITRAGFPPAITPAGMSLKTTAWMPITESRPILTPGSTET